MADTARLEVIVSKMNSLLVTTQETYTEALGILKSIKEFRKAIDEELDEGIDNAHKTWKGLIAKKKVHIEPLDMAERVIKDRCSNYLAEQEKIRRQEQERLDKLAREEEERLKEEARKNAQLEIDDDKAKQIEEDAKTIVVTAPKIEISAPAVEEITTRKIWKFEIEDVSLLPREYLLPDEKAIRAEVMRKQGETKIPGVRVFSEISIGARV